MFQQVLLLTRAYGDYYTNHNQAINYHWPFQKQWDPYFTQQLPILAGTSENNFFLNGVGIIEAAELQWRFYFFLLFAGTQ